MKSAQFTIVFLMVIKEKNEQFKNRIMKYPEVNTELCTGCELCIDACPMDAIIMENDTAKIIETNCSNCRDCESTCPLGAIS